MKIKVKTAVRALLLPLAMTGIIHSPVVAQGLDDAAIAHIAVTANQLDVTGAEQALEKSTDSAVRGFAETMIRDHRGVIAQAAALAERLGVTPKNNEHSRSLSSQAAEVRAELDHLHGPAFDRAYMQNEVAFHETVIHAVEQNLVPNASNTELRQLLEAVLPALRTHLEHAKQLSAELGGR